MLDFLQAWRTFNALEVFKDHPLAKGAAADITQASRHAVAGTDSFGQSRWSSLQGAEKTLKLYLNLKGERFPKIHELNNLAERCEREGLLKIDPAIIANAQCTAEARYAYNDKDTKIVLAANDAAMKIAYIAATNAPGGRPQPVPTLRVMPTGQR